MNIINKLFSSFYRFADKTAISEETRFITYSTLHKQSLKVALYLATHNIRNSCIAIEVTNCTDHIIAIIGTIISGNYYISITAENKPFLAAEDTFPVNLIICSDAANIPSHGVLLQDIFQQTVERTFNEPVIDPGDKLCAFFTSGSTGTSKIVIHNQRNIFTDTLRQIRENEITYRDKIDFIFSVGFSASLACIFPAVLTGAELCIFNLKEKGFHQLIEFWEHKAVTFATLSVTSFQSVCQVMPSLHQLKALRFICIGAEPVKNSTIGLFRAKFPSSCVLQIAYAATETRTISEIKILNNGKIQNYEESIGKPVTGKAVYILDENGSRLPAGCIGELAVESRFIAGSYWGKPEESLQSFAYNHDIIQYKTGDLGYINQDGYLFYDSRKNSGNKINGIKINLRNIEEEVEKITDIEAAVAIINKSNSDQSKLVCFYKTTGSDLSANFIKESIGSKLPTTHLPHLYVKLDDWPYTHTGKIDRKKLEQINLNSLRSEDPALTSKSDTAGYYERTIIEIFKKVLKDMKIDAESNFFDAGGDSLDSLLCVAEVESQLHIKLRPFVFISNPTPRKLGLFISQNQQMETDLVVAVELNEYSQAKRNLYFLSNSVKNKYHWLINTSLAAEFNLICLYYDLKSSFKVDNAFQLIITQLAGKIKGHENAVVMGYSFNGYIAHQLACLLSQISYCILVDTHNYFEGPVKAGPGAAIKTMFRQIFKNKDYSFPLFLVRKLYYRLTRATTINDNNFLEGINYFLARPKYKKAINNCIFFQASRSDIMTKNRDVNWNSYISGNFHYFNLFSEHETIMERHASTMAARMNELIVENKGAAIGVKS